MHPDAAVSRQPVIQARGLTRTRRFASGDRRVLADLDLEVAEGEVVAVRGPSGSGKSTLLGILGGLDSHWTGSVVVAGRELGEMDDFQRARLRTGALGILFQDYALLEGFSLLENVSLPRRLLGSGDRRTADDAARRLLDRVGLGELESADVSTLSGGERQRAALARALVNDPQILLCDEPTGNLDPVTGHEIMDLIDELRRQSGMTVVAATHDQELEGRAHRVLRLVDGRLEEAS